MKKQEIDYNSIRDRLVGRGQTLFRAPKQLNQITKVCIFRLKAATDSDGKPDDLKINIGGLTLGFGTEEDIAAAIQERLKE